MQKRVFGTSEYKKKLKKERFSDDDFFIEPIFDDNVAIIDTIPIADPELAIKASKALKSSSSYPRSSPKRKRNNKTEVVIDDIDFDDFKFDVTDDAEKQQDDIISLDDLGDDIIF